MSLEIPECQDSCVKFGTFLKNKNAVDQFFSIFATCWTMPFLCVQKRLERKANEMILSDLHFYNLTVSMTIKP